MIHRYKYQQHDFFEPLFRHWIRIHLNEEQIIKPDAIVPIPLHATKERERGFNQAARLATYFAESFNSPVHQQALNRIKPTETQTHLSRKKRLANMKNAFAIGSGYQKTDSVLLIDDVMTTGATVSECARTLKRAGARKVNVLTLARGLPV